MIISIQQPEYFPWIGYFDKFSKVDEVIILDNVQFKKRYFENRNKVRTANGWCWIRTPVLTKGRYDQRIMEVEIDNSLLWQRKLLATLRQNYANSPKWEGLGDELCAIIQSSSYAKLADFNILIIHYLADKLGLARKTHLASSLETMQTGSGLILEICRRIGCTTYLSGPDGANYLDEEAFAQQGIEIRYQNFTHPVYRQHQGGEFVPAMSALDMLFNLGTDCTAMFGEQARP